MTADLRVGADRDVEQVAADAAARVVVRLGLRLVLRRRLAAVGHARREADLDERAEDLVDRLAADVALLASQDAVQLGDGVVAWLGAQQPEQGNSLPGRAEAVAGELFGGGVVEIGLHRPAERVPRGGGSGKNRHARARSRYGRRRGEPAAATPTSATCRSAARC